MSLIRLISEPEADNPPPSVLILFGERIFANNFDNVLPNIVADVTSLFRMMLESEEFATFDDTKARSGFFNIVGFPEFIVELM